jgi:hypothetical protein
MRMTQKNIDQIVRVIAQNFRCFGGGQFTEGNPLSVALQNNPPQFAAGVDVRDVVLFVLKQDRDIGKKRAPRLQKPVAGKW